MYRDYGRTSTYLGAKAVAQSTQLLDAALLLQSLDGLKDDGIDIFRGVRVVPIATLGEPGHEVKAIGPVELKCVAIEDVDYQSQIAAVGELVGHEVRVLPETDDIGDVEKADILVRLALRRGGYVGIILSGDLDVLA